MKKLLTLILLAIVAILCTACSYNECERLIGEYTHQKGSDVYVKIGEFVAEQKPQDFTDGTIAHIYIIEDTTNCN